jgi:hypothetical protein
VHRGEVCLPGWTGLHLSMQAYPVRTSCARARRETRAARTLPPAALRVSCASSILPITACAFQPAPSEHPLTAQAVDPSLNGRALAARLTTPEGQPVGVHEGLQATVRAGAQGAHLSALSWVCIA